MLSTLQNIYSKTVQNLFERSLNDEAVGSELAKRQLWGGRYLALAICRKAVPFLDASCCGH